MRKLNKLVCVRYHCGGLIAIGWSPVPWLQIDEKNPRTRQSKYNAAPADDADITLRQKDLLDSTGPEPHFILGIQLGKEEETMMDILDELVTTPLYLNSAHRALGSFLI